MCAAPRGAGAERDGRAGGPGGRCAALPAVADSGKPRYGRGRRVASALFLPVPGPLRDSSGVSRPKYGLLFAGGCFVLFPLAPGTALPPLELMRGTFLGSACSCSQGNYPAPLSEAQRNPCFKIMIILSVIVT